MFIKAYFKLGLYPLTLLLVLLCFIKDRDLYLCLSIVCLIYSLLKFKLCISCLFLLGIVYFYPTHLTISNTHINDICVVTSIKEKSSVLQCGIKYYYLSNNYNVDLGDRVRVDGPIELMERPSGFYSFDQSEYNRAHRIYGYIKNANITIIGSQFSLKRCFYLRITSLNEKVGKNLYDVIIMNHQISEVMVYSSFIYTTIIHWIIRLLSFYFNEKQCKYIEFSLVLIVGSCVGFNFLLMRHLIKPFIQYLDIDKDHRFAITVLCWLIMSNGYVNTLTFIYPFMYYWLRLLNDNANFWDKTLLNWMIQSIYLNRFSLLNLLGFNNMRFIATSIYCFDVVYTLFIGQPLQLSMLSILDKLTIRSNPLGIGLIFFITIMHLFRYFKYKNVLGCLLFVLFSINGYFHPLAMVTFINVGQGDAIIVKDSFSRSTLLIDTGKKYAYSNVKSYLDALGIDKLTGLLITHSDIDHSENMNRIIHDYAVETIITSDFNNTNIGTIPIYNLNHHYDANDPNASSLTILVQCHGFRFLFPGDIPQEIEKAIISNMNLSVDVLKASHHGSKTGSSDIFLDTLNPKFLIYSAGAPSIYGHPSKEVMTKATKRNILQCNTYLHGDISFFIMGKYCFVLTSSGSVGLLVRE